MTSPTSVRVLEAGTGFSEAVAQIGLEADVLQQVLHRAVEFFIGAIRNLEAVLTGRLERCGVLMAEIGFEAIFHAFLTAYEAVVVL